MPTHPSEHAWLVRLFNSDRTHAPALPDPNRAPRPPSRLQVFAVGTDWVQLTWSALGPGPVTITCADRTITIEADGGPGAALIDGLPVAKLVDVVLSGAGIDKTEARSARLLTPPPGEELLRVATMSDVHLGSRSTGYLHTIVEIPEPAEPHALRCLRAAVGELSAWGADHIVVKGDLVDSSDTEQWEAARSVLGTTDLPVHMVPGNHERSKVGDVDPYDGAKAAGIDLMSGVQAVDHGGVRIVMADTTRAGTDHGTVRDVADDIVEAAAVDRPVFLALHHQPMLLRVPTYLPPGLPGPEVRRLFRRVAAVNPRVIASSGHTHRHRHHRISGITATEVGSTKDFPGTWAGYQIHEGGVIQTVRRIAEPSCIRWTDHTRRAAGGLWARWAPGVLSSRCFSEPWENAS